MEEMECNDLVKTARKFDSSSGSARALEVIEFASLCMTQVKSTLKGASAKLEKGQLPSYGSIPVAMVDALSEIAQDQESDWRRIWTALSEVRRLPKVKVFRRELLNEMHKVLRSTYDGAYESLSDAAWSIRDQARHEIRKLDHRLISRTLLVKGLEFDHCVVLKAEEWDAKSLYVAMTRGSQTLSILTANGAPVINYSGAG
jgi:DNA helicase-2/ATP-dependent DNA helicase PcrA